MHRRIRLVEPADAEALAELQSRHRDYFAPYDPTRRESWFTADGQRSDIAANLELHARGESVPFVILDDDGAVVGRITLRGIVHGALWSCAMGYWVSPDVGGRGYATQAVAAATEHAFDRLGLHRVQAETLVDNLRSQRVLEKNGYERFGMAPGYLHIAGEWRDHVMFQRLAGSGV